MATAEAPPAHEPSGEKNVAVADDKEKTAPAPPAATPRPEREAGFKDYVRIFTYARKWDYAPPGRRWSGLHRRRHREFAPARLLRFGLSDTPQTLPLMNVVFGKLVGNLAAFGQDSSRAQSLSPPIPP